MHSILTVVGARPHFIKAAMVSKAIANCPTLQEVIVHTGQHYDTLLTDIFIEDLKLKAPKYNLEVGSMQPASQIGKILIGLDEIIQEERPDLMIVYGDTNSTAAGAIAAAKNNIPLAHIEAGLREFDKRIPEEVNKLMTDAISDLFFCPTQTGVDNLNAAGIRQGVHLVGDVGIDLIEANYTIIKKNTAILERYKLQAGQYYLMSCHRAANTDLVQALEQILEAVSRLNLPVIWPIHPRTKKAIDRFGLNHYLEADHLMVIDPVGFWDLQSLLSRANMAITDSGGIIKEAYYHKVPAIIIDTQTEWIETVEEGWNQVVGANTAEILRAVSSFSPPAIHSNCLGDGTAAQKTIEIIDSFLKDREKHESPIFKLTDY